MKRLRARLRGLLSAETAGDRVVPPQGFTVSLTLFSAGAMAFLAVFALALSLAAGRLAADWGDALARGATLRISAPAEDLPRQTTAALRVLEQTPGIAAARALEPDEQAALLAPWLGPDLPLEALPVPQLIEVLPEASGYDPAGLRLRLQAEVPGAVLDDHARWRAPLLSAARGLRWLGVVVLVLIAGALAAMVTLAAQASLAANAQVIAVLRLVGATDDFVAGAFVRRFTLRALGGGAVGAFLALVFILLLPNPGETGALLTGLGFRGWHWILPFLVPPLAALVAFAATRVAARRALGELA